jgi:hypothetical protein
MRAWITREPWLDHYEVRLVTGAGRTSAAAVGVDERGNIIWSEIEEMAQVAPFLVLRDDVLEALARAAGEVTQASDQTIEALNDTRSVRDRLLSLVESVVTEKGKGSDRAD